MANTYGSPQTNPYPQAEFLDASSKRPTRPWQQFFINLLNFSSTSGVQTTSSVAGVAESGLTVSGTQAPAGFMQVTVNGKQYKVPYYNL
jgi:hypothetical protein